VRPEALRAGRHESGCGDADSWGNAVSSARRACLRPGRAGLGVRVPLRVRVRGRGRGRERGRVRVRRAAALVGGRGACWRRREREGEHGSPFDGQAGALTSQPRRASSIAHRASRAPWPPVASERPARHSGGRQEGARRARRATSPLRARRAMYRIAS